MWQLDGTLATLQHQSLIVVIDLAHSELGVAVKDTAIYQPPGQSMGNLWKLRFAGGSSPLAVADAWVRGRDLIAIYVPTSSQASRAEVYWRVVEDASTIIGLELVLSVQTDLPDDNPATCAETEIRKTTESWWLRENDSAELAIPIPSDVVAKSLGTDGPGSMVTRLPNRSSYIEMVYPSDFRGVEFGRVGEGVTLRSQLFEDRLEKGVIRRGRIRGWLVPTSGDLAAAIRFGQQFALSEPPLTT